MSTSILHIMLISIDLNRNQINVLKEVAKETKEKNSFNAELFVENNFGLLSKEISEKELEFVSNLLEKYINNEIEYPIFCSKLSQLD